MPCLCVFVCVCGGLWCACRVCMCLCVCGVCCVVCVVCVCGGGGVDAVCVCGGVWGDMNAVSVFVHAVSVSGCKESATSGYQKKKWSVLL